MKTTALILAAFVVVLVGIAALKGDGAVASGFRTAGSQFLRFVPVLAIAFLVMGFVDVLLPRSVVENWLTDSAGLKGIGLAWLAGILTPGGSIIGMPLAAGLFKAGVSPSVLITYLTSLACLSVMRIPLEVGFYGWRLTGMRVTACLIVPLVAGGVARLLTQLLATRGT